MMDAVSAAICEVRQAEVSNPRPSFRRALSLPLGQGSRPVQGYEQSGRGIYVGRSGYELQRL